MGSKNLEVDSVSGAPPRKGRVFLSCVVIVCAVVAAPVLFEVGLVCYGHWMEAFDRSVNVRTPILDRIHDQFHDLRHNSVGFVSSYADHAKLEATPVLIVGVIVMAVAAFMLRG